MNNWFLHTDNEGHEHEHVQELPNTVLIEYDQLEKGGSTREAQDQAFPNHDQPASSGDEHSAEVNYLWLYCGI